MISADRKNPTRPPVGHGPRLWHAIARVSVRRPWLILSLAAICAILSGIGASRLQPVGTLDAMLSDDAPASLAMRRIADAFSAAEDLVLLVTTPEDAALPTELLRAFARRLEDAIHASPKLDALCSNVAYQRSPDLQAFIEAVWIPNALLYVDDATFASILRRLSLEEMRNQIRRDEELIATPGIGGQAIAKTLLKDPLGLRDFLVSAMALPPLPWQPTGRDGLMLSEDGRSLQIRITGNRSPSDLAYAEALTSAMQRVAQRINEEGLDVRFTGAYAIAAASEQSIRSDMIRSMVMSIILLQVLFLLVYRDLWSFPQAIVPVALGILLAFGVCAALSWSLTPITAVIAAILAGLGVDYCIHFRSHYLASRRAGNDHASAITSALTGVGPAMLAACVTSLIGFLAVSQSSVQALREFARLGAVGLAGALVAAMTVLPALLTLVDRWLPVRCGGAVDSRLRMDGLMGHVTRRPRAWMTLSLVILAAATSIVATTRDGVLPLETDLTVMHPQPNPPLETLALLSERFQQPRDALLVHLSAASDEALTSLAHTVQDRLRDGMAREGDRTKEPALMRGSFGIANLLPEPAASTLRWPHIQSIEVDRILADFDAVVADSLFDPQAFQAYRQFLSRLLSPSTAPDVDTLRPYAGLADRLLSHANGEHRAADSHEAITLVLLNEPLTDRATRDATIDAIRGLLAGIEGATLTGFSVVGYDTERLIRHDLTRSLAMAAIAVVVWLLIYFRSLRATMLALLPALFGMVVLVAVMHVLDERVNMISMIGLPLLVGIGVDDGIFLVTLARKRSNDRGSIAECDKRLSAGSHAVVTTSLTTALTFGTLAFTATPAIQALGRLVAIGVVGSLAGTLFLLVPLLALRTAATMDQTDTN